MKSRNRDKIEVREEGNDFLHPDQGGLLYKAPLTASVFKDFSACYQHFVSQAPTIDSEQPFVYVDAQGVKVVTSVMEGMDASPHGVFALSVAQDGFVQMLALFEPG